MCNKSSSTTLTWHNVSVWARKKHHSLAWLRRVHDERSNILKSVSGFAKSGMLLAIMGASGAGKTTLLATISQKVKGEMEGELLVNGQAVNREVMSKLSGFVPQQDLCIESLSVSEHMEFMARLLMDKRVHGSQRTNRINSLLLEIGLMKCRHTTISALSGGERKRLLLAVQLLTDPPLLLCDEPTSGLDSYNASIIVKKLNQLSSRGKVVICTIHQPPSGIFETFSHVLILAGGRVAFHGDVLGAKRHFNGLGFVCPSTYNQAEFFVSQLAVRPGYEDESKSKIQWVCDQFSSSAYGVEMMEQISIASTRSGKAQILYTETEQQSSCKLFSCKIEDHFSQLLNRKKPGFCTQFYWLAKRSIINMKRDSSHTILLLILYSIIALLISLPYISTELDQKRIKNLQALLYFTITETIFTFSYSVTNLFPQEIPILLREISNSLYNSAPYYLAKVTVLLPQTILGSVIYTGIIFWIADLDGGAFGFLMLCVPVTLSAISATAYGCMMSAAFESVSTIILLSAPLDVFGLTFSGLFLQLSALPPQVSWMRYLSPFYYGTEAISILEWNHIHNIQCYERSDFPCISTGSGVLDLYGFHSSNFTLDVTGLIAFYCISHLFGFLAICRRSKCEPVY
ncbi:protein scarlet-like [Periplaneta americana]|uniref:protein scarlet-like n=1 Tax=Periplaneta americana TaxID=6978 RepID=UPI0037E73D89